MPECRSPPRSARPRTRNRLDDRIGHAACRQAVDAIDLEIRAAVRVDCPRDLSSVDGRAFQAGHVRIPVARDNARVRQIIEYPCCRVVPRIQNAEPPAGANACDPQAGVKYRSSLGLGTDMSTSSSRSALSKSAGAELDRFGLAAPTTPASDE